MVLIPIKFIIGFVLVGLSGNHLHVASGLRLDKRSHGHRLDGGYSDEEPIGLMQIGIEKQVERGTRSLVDDHAPDASVETPPPPREGKPRCSCVSADIGSGRARIGKKDVFYPKKVGSHCAAWDNDIFPGHCKDKDQVPGSDKGWCAREWCYVDPCSCDLGVAAMTSFYFPDATYNGKKLHFSYATCDDKHVDREPCNQLKSADQCKTGQNCEWTGHACLQSELAALCMQGGETDMTNNTEPGETNMTNNTQPGETNMTNNTELGETNMTNNTEPPVHA